MYDEGKNNRREGGSRMRRQSECENVKRRANAPITPRALERRADEMFASWNYEQSSAAYAQAIRLESSLARHTRLRIKLARAMSLSGDSEGALAQFERVCDEAIRSGEFEVAAGALDELSRQYWMNAQTPVAAETARRLIALQLPSNSPLKIMGYTTLARHLTALGLSIEADAILDRAEVECENASMDAVASFLEVRAYTRAKLGDLSACIDYFGMALRIAEARSDVQSIVYKLNNAACSFRNLGLTELAVGTHERALEMAERHGLGWRLAYVLLSYAGTRICMGRLREARELFEKALKGLQNTATRLQVTAIGLFLGVRFRDDSMLEVAWDPSALNAAFQSEEPQRIGPLSASVLDYFEYVGDDGAAASLLDRALTVRCGDGCHRLILAAALAGKKEHVSRARWLLSTLPRTAVTHAFSELVDAIAPMSDGAADQWRARAASAATKFEKMGWDYYKGLALEQGGRYSEAESIYKMMGAVEDVQRVRSIRRPRGRPRRIPGELTPRQREICSLVASGTSNAEISRILGVAPRTVKYHLTSVYAEFGVTKRSELAAALDIGGQRTSD